MIFAFSIRGQANRGSCCCIYYRHYEHKLKISCFFKNGGANKKAFLMKWPDRERVSCCAILTNLMVFCSKSIDKFHVDEEGEHLIASKTKLHSLKNLLQDEKISSNM